MRGLFIVVGLLALVASCGFSPKPKNGKLPCDNGCPSGYFCGIGNRCWLTNAPAVDGGADSPTGNGGIISTGGVMNTDGPSNTAGVAGAGGVTGTGGTKTSGAGSTGVCIVANGSGTEACVLPPAGQTMSNCRPNSSSYTARLASDCPTGAWGQCSPMDDPALGQVLLYGTSTEFCSGGSVKSISGTGGTPSGGGWTSSGGTHGDGGFTVTGGSGGNQTGGAGVSGTGGGTALGGTLGVGGSAAQSTAECSTLTNPENGAVTVPSTSSGSMATYECSGSFSLVGNPYRKCQSDGSWSGAAPTCECPSGQVSCKGTCVNTQTDNKNCGGCSTVCSATSPSSAQCTLGRCLVTLVPDPHGAPNVGIAVDSTNVYFGYMAGQAAAWAMTLMKVPVAGGTSTSLAPRETAIDGIATDSSYVYWTDSVDGTLMKVSPQGGTPNPLASGLTHPGQIAVDATGVYAICDGLTLFKVSLSGGTPTQLVSVTSATSPNTISSMAVNATGIYWGGCGGVSRVGLAGGTSSSLAALQGCPENIVVNAKGIYWTDMDFNTQTGSVKTLPLEGGAPATVGTSLGSFVTALAVDDTNIYWVDHGSTTAATIMRTPLGGGSAVTLASGQDNPISIVVDATSVYWESFGGAIMKLSPK